MQPADFLSDVIVPALAILAELGGPAPSAAAERFMLAIALTESGPQLNARYQGSPNPTSGPAKGWWQFEQNGSLGVLTHRASATLAIAACEACRVVTHAAPATRALEGHDMLAAMFARLLILTEPRALPGNAKEGYEQYLNLWRPGKPQGFDRWGTNWNTADETCRLSGREFTSY